MRTHYNTIHALLFRKVEYAPINMAFDDMGLDAADAPDALLDQTARTIECFLSKLLALGRMS